MSIQPQLTQLESAGLLRVAAVEPELLYLFRHGLIQDATYSTLLRGQRRAWHAATARVLEGACQTEAEMIAAAPILATHYTLADDQPRALHFLTMAGDSAFDHYANVEAAAFYTQALAIAVQAEANCDDERMAHLFSRTGRALELTSRFEAALDNYHAMEREGARRGDLSLQLAAISSRATIHSTANMHQDLPEAMRLLERAGALAHDLGDPAAEARINWTLMLNNSMAGGTAERSLGYGQRALELARANGQRELTAFVLMDMWFALGSSGRWDEARANLQESYSLARELGNLTLVGENTTRLAMNAQMAGEYDASLAYVAAGMQAGEQLNSNDTRALARITLCVTHSDRGDYDQAIQAAELAIAFGERSGNVTSLIGTRGDLALAYGDLGNLEHGLELTRQAAADSDRFPLIAAWGAASGVMLKLRLGDLDGAAMALAELPNFRELMRSAGFVPTMWIRTGEAGVRLALARGEGQRAAALAEELLGHLERLSVVFARPEVRLLHAQALLALGETEAAEAGLRQARLEAERLGARRLLWPILATLAEIDEARGEPAARTLRQLAREHIGYIAAHTPSSALSQSFLAQGEVQRVLRAAG
jgi:tetratricopeptide (TPR) repeat protein